MARDEFAARFCEGCPVRQEYIGEVSVERIETSVKIARDGLVHGSRQADEFVTTTIALVDIDGCSSSEAAVVHTFSDLEKSGLEFSVDEHGEVRKQKKIKKQIAGAVEAESERLVRRITNCEGPSSNESGKKSCPAMSKQFLVDLVTSGLETEA